MQNKSEVALACERAIGPSREAGMGMGFGTAKERYDLLVALGRLKWGHIHAARPTPDD